MTSLRRAARRGTVATALACIVTSLTASRAVAQTSGQRGTAAAASESAPGEHARLERQLRQRLALLVQRRLRLSDAQLSRLQETNAAYESRRRALAREERTVRTELRTELARDAAADQPRVSQLLDRAIAIQRDRLDLVASEQRELAKFLTPVQRARYLIIQEQLRRRVEELRRREESAAPGERRRVRPMRRPA